MNARRALPVLAACLVALPFALSSLSLPFGRDQGIYAMAADEWLHGAALYRDVYVFKTPMTVYVHALALLSFGHSMVAIRAFDAVWTLATVAALYGVVRAAFGHTHGTMGTRLAAATVGVAFAVVYHQGDWWNSAQTDGWTNLPTALAMLLLFRDGRRPVATRFGAGVLLGVSFLFKYTLGAMLPVALVVLAVDRGRASIREGAALIAGFLAAIGALALLLVVEGGWSAFVESQLQVLAPYAGARSQARNWAYAKKILWNMPDTFVVTATLGAAVATLGAGLRFLWRGAGWRRDVAALLLIPGWLAAAVVSLVVQGRFFPYHFVPLLGPGALATVWLVALVVDLLPVRARSAVAGLAAAGALAYAATQHPYPPRWRLLADLATGRQTFDRYWRSGPWRNRDMSVADNLAVADWLREHTAPDEKIFVWSYDPMVYFLADRRPVSRFPYTYPLVVTWGPDAYDAELLAALKDDPPKVFVVGSHDATPPVMGHGKDSWATFQESGPLHDWVTARYAETATVKRFRLYTPIGDAP